MSEPRTLNITSTDGHQFQLLHVTPAQPAVAQLLWLPALGVAARHYLPLAHALARHGCAVSLHEWRGHGSSSLRANRQHNWGFTQLLHDDLPAAVNGLHAAGIHIDTLGGHSLGGQLSCCLAPSLQQLKRLWLVASGSPHWRSFAPPQRYSLPLAYTALPGIAWLRGHLPGKQLGFGGREARGLIADWARVGRSGHYHLPAGVEQQMAGLQLACHGITLAEDWLAPDSSLDALLAKLPACDHQRSTLDAAALGVRADHFAWMRQPAVVADTLLRIFP